MNTGQETKRLEQAERIQNNLDKHLPTRIEHTSEIPRACYSLIVVLARLASLVYDVIYDCLQLGHELTLRLTTWVLRSEYQAIYGRQ